MVSWAASSWFEKHLNKSSSLKISGVIYLLTRQDPTAWTPWTFCVLILLLQELSSGWGPPDHPDILAGLYVSREAQTSSASCAKLVSRALGRTSYHGDSPGAQTPGRIKWTRAQDCNLKIKALECLKITLLAEEMGLEREKQFLNYMVSVSREEKSFGVGGRWRGAHEVHWASFHSVYTEFMASLPCLFI